MSLRACAHINLAALQHNLLQVKNFAPQARVIAMIKADAYGHGLLRVANNLSTADAFGVATLDEAIILRQTGITKPIVLMGGFINAEELKIIADKQFIPVIHNPEQVRLLQDASLTLPLSIWLKLDSGMHRLGFLPSEFNAAYAQLSTNSNIKKPIGFLTHLACSDEPDNPHTLQQLKTFQENVTWMGPRSIACSAAIIAWPQTHVDCVRPGIMLYGISPFAHRTGLEFGLKPVMTLTSRLIAIKQLSRGDTVGYGASWTCSENTRLGVVSIGYGDGYPRQARHGTPVLVNGKRCTLIGKVSMDLICVDLSTQPDAQIGDEVVLWGEGLPVEEIALHADTISYELLCKVTARVPFSNSGIDEVCHKRSA